MKNIIKKTYNISRNLPENFIESDRRHFEDDLKNSILENHVKTFNNAFILQIYLISKFRVQSKYCFTRAFSLKKEIKVLIKSILFSKRKLNSGLWVLDQWSLGYYHWLVEVLPRLISAEQVNCKFPVLLPKQFISRSYINESLIVFKKEVITYDLNEKLKIKTLQSPSHLDPANGDPIILKKVRDRFKVYDQFTNDNKKVYISRSKAERRFVINEKELQDFLKNYCFETYYMEDLSFYDQRKLMAETKVLISNHGAGLTNMLFMKENGIIIELKSDSNDVNNCFFNLARALDHKYYYSINFAEDKRVQRANIIVDFEALKLILDKIEKLI